MRSDRLLAIVLMLQSRGTVPAPELAGELEVSTRTIYRDMEALSTAGVPVYAERGRAGGCGLLPGYRTDVSGLTAEETRALFAVTGRGMLADLGLEPALRGAMRKLTASLPADQRGDAARVSARVVVDPRRWRAANEQLPHLAAIQQAVWTDRRLRMRYGGSGRASVSTYTVDPYGLITKAGVWYLLAAHRGAPRLYRVARVSGVTILPRRSSRPDGLDLEALWQQLRARVERPSAAAVDVRFRVRAARTDMVLRVCRPQFVGEPVRATGPDGDDDVTVGFRAIGAARGVLLGFGADVEVLSPAALRVEMAATAREVVSLYAG